MRVSCFGVFVARQVCLVFEEEGGGICVFSRGRVGWDLLNSEQTTHLLN